MSWSPRKVPLTAAGKVASSTDPSTWAPFSAVRSLPRKGFVLNGDGIVCIDIDHCITDGALEPAAAEWVAELPRTYVEVSPSGTGLHIWGHGDVTLGRRLTFRGLHVEVYGTGRYMTVTGRPMRGSVPRLADLSDHLAPLMH